MNDISFKDLYFMWYDHHKIEIAASTAYTLRLQYARFGEYFGNILLKDMTSDLVQGFIKFYLKILSPTTVNKYCQTLKLCFDFAISKGYLHDSPLNDCSIPKRQRVTIYPFTPEEINLVLKQDAPDWVRDGIMIAFRTGMRLGEIFALKWCNINFDQQFISIQEAQSRAGSQVYTKMPKSEAGVRRIDIDTKLALRLLDMHDHLGCVSHYVFPSPRYPDKYRIPWNISTQLRKMCRSAGIPERNFHALRHTHATILFAYGKHPKMVQERLGHADIRTTLSTYSHTVPTLQKEAVEVFENL